MQSLKLFVLMFVVMVAAACAPAPEPKIIVTEAFSPSAVVVEEAVSVPGVALTYVVVKRFGEITEIRKVLVDNTVKFAVGDTVKLTTVQYRSASTSSLQVIWSIAK